MAVSTSRHLQVNKLSAALIAAMLAASGGAIAQEQQQEESSQAKSSSEQAATIDNIVVTGSRIGRDTFNSVSPVQVITREEATVAGFSSTSAVLQSNAITGGASQVDNSYGGYVVNGGPGVNTLSLRGLGATRTLMLLNGRRVSPAGSRGAVGSADLNVLPNIMVHHVEVLKDGASSIYGSDAVAGVVNVITRPKVDGTTVELQHNQTQDGGGNQTRASIMSGFTGDRWRVAGSLEVLRRSEMILGDRSWAGDCPTPLEGRNPDGTYGANDFVDPATGKPKCWTIDAGGVTINTLGTARMPGQAGSGATGTSFNRWRPNADVTTGFAGYEGVGLYDRDSYHPDMLRKSLISPTRNTTGFLQASFDLNAFGNAELYFESLMHRRESSQNGYTQHSMDYAVGSPLLGALDWLPAFMRAPADGSTNGKNVAARAFVGWGITKSRQTVDFFRTTVGLRGDLGTEWSYDAFFSHARSDADYFTPNRLTNRIAKSMDVVSDGKGGFVCRDTSDGCVAAPVLSHDVIAGKLPQNWRDYVMQNTRGSTVYTESTFNFGVNGPLFDIPHGTVRGAFGFEHRRQEIDDTPDINSINNNLYGYTASTFTRGKDNVSELYAEVEAPLLSGIVGAEELALNLSARYTNYASYGSGTTWKIGFLWTPVRWLSLRASNGTSFRAPALFEQHLGATSGFLGASNDPCNDWGSRDATSARYQNCSSLGLPADFNQTSSITAITKGGAETGLASETSKAFTAGIIIQPEFPQWFGDLSFAADYYDIKVNNGVSRLSGTAILTRCYDSQPSDFKAGAGLCSLVQRNANNGLTVTSGYVNISESTVRGWDFTARYSRDIGPGTFRINAQVSNYLTQAGRTFPTDPLRNSTGNVGSPQYTGQMDLSYTFKNWFVRYGLDWVGKSDSYKYYDKYYDTDYRSDYLMVVDDYYLHSASVQYRGDNWSATFGIRNLADKEPPMVSNSAFSRVGNAPLYSGYDFFGRTFFFNLTKSF